MMDKSGICDNKQYTAVFMNSEKKRGPASQHRMQVSNMFTKINRRNSERDELFYLLLFFMLCRFRCADGTLTLQ